MLCRNSLTKFEKVEVLSDSSTFAIFLTNGNSDSFRLLKQIYTCTTKVSILTMIQLAVNDFRETAWTKVQQGRQTLRHEATAATHIPPLSRVNSLNHVQKANGYHNIKGGTLKWLKHENLAGWFYRFLRSLRWHCY